MVSIDTENFTPLESSLGGALIGIAAVIMLISLGRIAGISGALGGIFTLPLKKDHLWRITFIISLIAGGLIMHFALQYSINPEMQSWYSVIGAGFLVGTGTRIGNGCTSGHGVCGLSRLSFRSIMGTFIFMTTGVAAAYILPMIKYDWIDLIIAVAIVIPLFIVKLILKIQKKMNERKIVQENENEKEDKEITTTRSTTSLADEEQSEAVQDSLPWHQRIPLIDSFMAGISGLIFGIGLSLSGMTKPSKVISFLQLLSDNWDPSLAFVMGVAVIVGSTMFTFILPPKYLNPALNAVIKQRAYHEKLPLFNRSKWYVPSPKGPVDWNLFIGTAVFGLGWGMAGMCPGPALIVGMFTAKGITFCGVMVVTMTAFNYVKA